MSDLFQEIILDEAKHPANYGTLSDSNLKQVHYNPSCGDTIHVMLKVDTEKKIVTDLKWTGEGCTVSMATMSLLSKEVIGKEIAVIKQYDQQFLLSLLELETITSGRVKCLSLGLKAVQDILADL